MLQLKDLQEFIEIRIVDNDMKGLIFINEDSRATQPIPEQLLKDFLNKSQILFGIDEIALSKICTNPQTYIKKAIEIAKGQHPIHGEDAKIEWIVLNEKKENKPKLLDDGRVDYYSINSVMNVKSGELIARKVPNTQGEAGKTVKGKIIQSKPGKDIPFKIGKNIVVNQTKDKIYAAIDGQLIIEDKVHVLSVYEVQGDVDFSVGNINFIGTVNIRGNVMDGFKIHATGDINVFGFVEGAELVSGGSIEIQQGIIGHNKSKIKAEKNIKVSYITDGDVYAGDSIYVAQSIMHSEVNASNEIYCGGTKGLIVGGKIKAGSKVAASNIGNQLATVTTIEVGMNPLLRQELNELQSKRKESSQSQDKIKKALHIIDRLQRTVDKLPLDKKNLQIELLDKQLLIDRAMKEMDRREHEIETEMNKIDQASIEVKNTVYPGVKLVIGNYRKFIKDQQKYVRFVFEDGEIATKQL